MKKEAYYKMFGLNKSAANPFSDYIEDIKNTIDVYQAGKEGRRKAKEAEKAEREADTADYEKSMRQARQRNVQEARKKSEEQALTPRQKQQKALNIQKVRKIFEKARRKQNPLMPLSQRFFGIKEPTLTEKVQMPYTEGGKAVEAGLPNIFAQTRWKDKGMSGSELEALGKNLGATTQYESKGFWGKLLENLKALWGKISGGNPLDTLVGRRDALSRILENVDKKTLQDLKTRFFK